MLRSSRYRPWRGGPIKGDIGSSKFCAELVANTIKAFGRLDVLVNNAAEQHEKEDVEEISEEQLVRTFRTNLFGYFFMIQAALPHMKRGSTRTGFAPQWRRNGRRMMPLARSID
jgi:NAD(P)-dependent dehydrogenase (short-subunit alcohol dehydrogenase family)